MDNAHARLHDWSQLCLGGKRTGAAAPGLGGRVRVLAALGLAPHAGEDGVACVLAVPDESGVSGLPDERGREAKGGNEGEVAVQGGHGEEPMAEDRQAGAPQWRALVYGAGPSTPMALFSAWKDTIAVVVLRMAADALWGAAAYAPLSALTHPIQPHPITTPRSP